MKSIDIIDALLMGFTYVEQMGRFQNSLTIEKAFGEGSEVISGWYVSDEQEPLSYIYMYNDSLYGPKGFIEPDFVVRDLNDNCIMCYVIE